MMLGIAQCCIAQKGLQIDEVFKGKVVARQHMQESLIKGENLAPYNLKVLHTVKFKANNSQRARTDALFEMDMRGRISDDDCDMEMESRNGFIYYAIVRLTSTKQGLHRFICYQCKEKGGGFNITLAYMEGTASLADLRNTFKKK